MASADDSTLAHKVTSLLEAELSDFTSSHPGSKRAHHRAATLLPLGVASSFQFFEPFPITIDRADGAWAWDADGRRYLDLNMGFGALLVGHRHPYVLQAVTAQLERGTLFVAPNHLASEVAELLKERFCLPKWRFTNSGTEALQTAVRLSRAATGRDVVVKVEGGYHGHTDALLVAAKPGIQNISEPMSREPDSTGIPRSVSALTYVVPFNDLSALERVFSEQHPAAFIVEPVMENIGIALPDAGYLRGVRDLCTRHGVVLVFDEVKTGLTASWSGASGLFGVTPDLVCLAKSIGGGFPIGALGGSEAVMSAISEGAVHHGTYNGNPLVLAATKATLEVCSPDALESATAKSRRLAASLDEVLAGLPHAISTIGTKGCIAWRPTPVRSYRDWFTSDKQLAELAWVWGLNRGVLTPPGLDEQWLVSLAHDDAACSFYTEVIAELAAVLCA
jgi:glutamate-1-semialdehyde 2,1-aminomutase